MPSPQKTDALTLRERKKAEVRANVLKTARELFHARGFDATTVEEICAACAISKRTFFRYFADKEALMFPHREERLQIFMDFLREHEQSESPFDTLRVATRVFGGQYGKKRDRILAQQAMMRSSQALQAREREIDKDWELEIARSFARRSGPNSSAELWARVLAGAIMGVVRATMDYWFERGCEDDLILLGLDAIDRLQRGFPPREG